MDDLRLGLAFLRVLERGVLTALLDAEAQDAVEVYLPPARPSLGRHRERCVLVRDHALEHRRATSASWLPEATAHGVPRASAPRRGQPREQVVAFCDSQSVPEAPTGGPPMARKAVGHNATAHVQSRNPRVASFQTDQPVALCLTAAPRTAASKRRSPHQLWNHYLPRSLCRV